MKNGREHARTPDGRLVPKVIAIGNHEIKGAGYHPVDAPGPEAAVQFYDLFHFPEGKNATHTVDFGDWFSLVMLDSGHTKNIASQTRWLGRTLRERARVPHLFACYHRPAWGTGTKADAVHIRQEWCPLFERHRVTAVFENDHHNFCRTHPLKDGEVDEKNGVPYLGAGAWNVSTREPDPEELKKRPWIAASGGVNHVYVVETRPGGWSAEAIGMDGGVIDRYQREWRR